MGATCTGTVNVNIIVDNAPSLNITRMQMVGGNYIITGAGIPNVRYRVQVADSATPTTWMDYDTVDIGPDGVINYTDLGPLPATRIYRFVYP